MKYTLDELQRMMRITTDRTPELAEALFDALIAPSEIYYTSDDARLMEIINKRLEKNAALCAKSRAENTFQKVILTHVRHGDQTIPALIYWNELGYKTRSSEFDSIHFAVHTKDDPNGSQILWKIFGKNEIQKALASDADKLAKASIWSGVNRKTFYA